MSFSTSFPPKVAPLSLPPWLGSIITKNSGVRFWPSAEGMAACAGVGVDATSGACGCKVKVLPSSLRAQHRATTARIASPATVLLQCINCQTAQQLGIEVSGFLRQHLAAESDIANLLNLGRIHQECDVRALANPGDCFKGVPLITDVFLVADRFFGNSQDSLQHNVVQLDYIKFALQCGKVTQYMLNRILLCPHEIWPLTRYRNKRCSVLSSLPQQCGGTAAFCSEIDSVNIKKLSCCFQHALAIEVQQAMDNPVCGENHQAAAFHGNERHHYKFVRRVRIGAAAFCAAFVAIRQRGFISVMPVGNQQLLIPHLLLHGVNDCRVMNAPHSMQGLIFIQQRDVSIFFHPRFEQAFDLIGGITVKHEYLAKMCSRGT